MAVLRPPRTEGAVLLEDGRQLGYAEFGPRSGRPLLWFHGTPGARRQIAPEAHESAWQRDVRIICVERPGIGASTPHAYGAVIEFAADIARLLDALEVGRVAVAGLSGGGPYALACAHEMPGRIVAAGILGGVAPSRGVDAAEGGTSALTRLVSPLLRLTRKPSGVLLSRLIQTLEPLADQAVDLFASFMPPGDQRIFADAATRRMFQEDLLLGSRHNMQALFLDIALFGRDWGFALGDVRVPVHLWYGDADSIVPVQHGEHMARRLPEARLRIRREEGHLGGLGASQEIFDALLAHFEAASAERGD